MSDLPLIDMVAATVVFAAMVRGLWIGLVREGLSLAAIGLCTIVTRLLLDPAARQLTEATGGEIVGKTATWIAGVLLVMATILACGLFARVMRKGVEFAGLGWADRVGGGALGLAEGTLVAAVLVMIAVWLVGPEHPTTDGARSVAIVDEWRSTHLEDLEGELPSVASPGSWFGDDR
ncbi:MAG: CvpA family protein [Myxococcota bacterium]